MESNSKSKFYYQDCLTQELIVRVEDNHRYSLRAFAKSLCMNPGMLSQIISGKRTLTANSCEKIVSNLSLSPQQAQKFRRSVDESLHKQSKKSTYRVSENEFRMIGDWYHFAIIELSKTRSLKYNIQTISSGLGISPTEAKIAIDRLIDADMLSINNKNILIAKVKNYTFTSPGTNAARKKHQIQIRKKAVEALVNQPVEERPMTSKIVAIDPSKIPKAKEMILEFNEQLSKFLSEGEKTKVYAIEMGLFNLEK